MMIERNPPGLPSVVVFVDFPYGFSPIDSPLWSFSWISPTAFLPFLPFRPTEIHLNAPL